MSAPKNQTTWWSCSPRSKKSWKGFWFIHGASCGGTSIAMEGCSHWDLYSSPPADFFLRAVIIWCIHDYPALGTMSGQTTHGYNACVHCDRNPLSYAILSKICYIGHRSFLANDKPHPRKYRIHVFNAKHENRDAPKRLTADELQVELEKVTHITPGNHPSVW